MAVVAQRWTLNALAVEFAMNHRTAARRLARVEPAGRNERGDPCWLMADAAPAVLGFQDARATAADLNTERTRLTKAQADAAELKLAVQRGELLPADGVVAAWEGAIIRARSLLASIPAALTDELMGLAAAGDPQAVHDLLSERIRDALEELASTEVEDDEEEEES